MKKSLIICFIFFLAYLSLSFVKAEILISQPKQLYNIGDRLMINFSLFEYSQKEGLASLQLSCIDKVEQNKIFYSFYMIDVPAFEETKLDVPPYPLSLKGDCYITANFDLEEKKTANFIVTDRIDINLESNKQYLKPGENLVISGKARKANLVEVEGIAMLNVGNLSQLTETVKVEYGNFSFSLIIPENMPPGAYNAEIIAEEKTNYGTNTGKNFLQIYILNIPMKLEITINNATFSPFATLIAKSLLYNQVNEQIEENVTIKITDSNNKIIYEGAIITGNSLEYLFQNKASPGEWKISASSQNLIAERSFYVEPYESLSFEQYNDTVKVSNTGNVPYDKPVRFEFKASNGSTTSTIKQITLDVDKSTEFSLTAPPDIYDVNVSSEENQETFTKIPLTGKVTDAIEFKEPGLFSQYPIASFIFFVILLIIVTWLLKTRIFRKNYYYRTCTNKTQNR